MRESNEKTLWSLNKILHKLLHRKRLGPSSRLIVNRNWQCWRVGSRWGIMFSTLHLWAQLLDQSAPGGKWQDLRGWGELLCVSHRPSEAPLCQVKIRSCQICTYQRKSVQTSTQQQWEWRVHRAFQMWGRRGNLIASYSEDLSTLCKKCMNFIVIDRSLSQQNTKNHQKIQQIWSRRESPLSAVQLSIPLSLDTLSTGVKPYYDGICWGRRLLSVGVLMPEGRGPGGGPSIARVCQNR